MHPDKGLPEITDPLVKDLVEKVNLVIGRMDDSVVITEMWQSPALDLIENVLTEDQKQHYHRVFNILSRESERNWSGIHLRTLGEARKLDLADFLALQPREDFLNT